MAISDCPLHVEENQMERQPLNPSLLACSAYRGDIHGCIASQVPPHWHHGLELLRVDSGEIEVWLAELHLRLRAGQGYFVNADKLHSIRCATDGPCRYRSLVFDADVVSGAVGSVFDLGYVRPLLLQGPPALALGRDEGWHAEVFRAFEAAHAACAAEEFGYEFAVRGALSRIVLELKRSGGESARSRPATLREERLKQMIAWVDANYTRPVTLRDLADAAHLSPRECERVFRQLLQTTPSLHLLRRRITAAIELLTNGDLPMIEVAARCGFASPGYFSRQFRAATGYTPRDYRAGRNGPRAGGTMP